jgi:hypothetical protein
MKLVLSIKADTNDADYVTQQTVVTPEQIVLLEPIFETIKAFKPYKTKTEDGKMDWTHKHNWPVGSEYMPRYDLGEKDPKDIYAGKLTEEQVEFFQDLCPYGEHGIHTIVEIKVMEVADERIYYTHKYR